MATNECHIHWGGAGSETVTFLGQNIVIMTDVMTVDQPRGALHIHAEGFVGTPLFLPNSMISSPQWNTIPGTNPALEVRQDGHYPTGYIRVRFAGTFTNLAPVHANIILGAVPAATRLESQGDVTRMRGFLQATGVVASGAVLANIATLTHRPTHAVSTGVRYSGGSNRFQVTTGGDVSLSAALALNDQVWLDGLTFDLLA